MYATVYSTIYKNLHCIKNLRMRKKIMSQNTFTIYQSLFSLCCFFPVVLHVLIPLWWSERVNKGKIKIISDLNLLFSLFLASKYILLKKILNFSAHTHINLTNCRPLTERVRCLGRSKTVTVRRSEW